MTNEIPRLNVTAALSRDGRLLPNDVDLTGKCVITTLEFANTLNSSVKHLVWNRIMDPQLLFTYAIDYFASTSAANKHKIHIAGYSDIYTVFAPVVAGRLDLTILDKESENPIFPFEAFGVNLYAFAEQV